jgi:hypothetical protein
MALVIGARQRCHLSTDRDGDGVGSRALDLASWRNWLAVSSGCRLLPAARREDPVDPVAFSSSAM